VRATSAINGGHLSRHGEAASKAAEARRTIRVSDANSIAVLERTSLNVYGADIFNYSRHTTLVAAIDAQGINRLC
jgi:hypothetical protein